MISVKNLEERVESPTVALTPWEASHLKIEVIGVPLLISGFIQMIILLKTGGRKIGTIARTGTTILNHIMKGIETGVVLSLAGTRAMPGAVLKGINGPMILSMRTSVKHFL